MRIVVNDLAASQTGALAVLKSFYTYIRETDTENEWIFLLSDSILEETDRIRIHLIPEVKKSWLHKLYFDFIAGKRVIEALKPDYVLSLQNIVTFGPKCRQGVYIHQSIPFQNVKRFRFLKRDESVYAVYQYLIGSIIKLSARKADDVFVQTNWMKEAVSKRAKIPESKITAVPMRAARFERTGISPEKNRFFYPAGFDAVYKNHACIYQACEMLDRQGVGDYAVLLTLPASGKPVSAHIRFVGTLNKAQMQEEYQRSVLLFPSYIETVGLPLLEAAQTGAVIFAADCEYAREALSGYENVRFFDPMKPEALAALIKSCMDGSIPLTIGRPLAEDGGAAWQALTDCIEKRG